MYNKCMYRYRHINHIPTYFYVMRLLYNSFGKMPIADVHFPRYDLLRKKKRLSL